MRRGVIICRNCTFWLKLAHYIVNCCCFYPLLNKKSLRLAAATSLPSTTTKSSLLNFPPTLVLSLIETIYQVSQYQTNIESAAANLILSLLLLALLSYYLIWQRQFCNFFEKSCTIQLSKFQFLGRFSIYRIKSPS